MLMLAAYAFAANATILLEVLKIRNYTWQIIGVVGSLLCLALFIHEPSFPTPDKLIIFLAFVFMIFKQAVPMLKRLLPFVGLLFVYESFRSVADRLNSHVNYSLAPSIDKALFGNLPTHTLQRLWWHGHVQWYDFVFCIPYTLFFALPVALALLVWKTREQYYWRVVGTYLGLFFAGFATFLAFPAAPPWLAAEHYYIQPIARVSSYVWAALGIQNFPSVYNRVSPNAVAALPSLHAACATLFFLFIYKLYGWRWGLVAAIYPLLIYVGVVYQGEHYAFDVIVGIGYAVAAYLLMPMVGHYLRRAARRIGFTQIKL